VSRPSIQGKSRDESTGVFNGTERSFMYAYLGLIAITVMFGFQTLRVLVPGLTWILGDRIGLGAVELGGIALVIFACSFLAGTLLKKLTARWTIVFTAGGLGLLRLVMQLWWGEPLFNLVLAGLGTMLFVLFIPVLLEISRSQGRRALNFYAIGFLLGLITDTAMNGAFFTYDMVWRNEPLPIVLTVLLVLILWVVLYQKKYLYTFDDDIPVALSGSRRFSWIALGPFIFIQLVIFQNIARLTTLTDWTLPLSFAYILLTQIIALVVVIWWLKKQPSGQWLAVIMAGVVLIIISFFTNQAGAWINALEILIGQVSLSILFTVLVTGACKQVTDTKAKGISVPHGLGMIVLVILLLGYYAVYQITLPYSNTVLELAATIILTISALFASISHERVVVRMNRVWLVPVLAALFLILPLAGILMWQQPKVVEGNGFPIKVMTYNLHNGFDTKGYLGMEELAQIIEKNDPDIVALQEISRGWLISGRVDMMTWLSQRLKMPYVFGPTADPYWGSAILSRYPIIEHETFDLPPRDLFILRGFTIAQIDIGGNTPLQVIATHYHHLEEDSEIRVLQSRELVKYLDSNTSTVLMGDFNAQPDAPEVRLLIDSGLVDAAASASSSPSNTFHADDAYERIDYIWVSKDIKIRDVFVQDTTASDHLPVIAVIEK